MMLVLFFMLFPIFLDIFDKEHIFLTNLFKFLIQVFLLLSKGEKFCKVFFQLLSIVTILQFLHLLLILQLSTLIIFFSTYIFVKLRAPIVLGLDMGVKGGIAKIWFPAITWKVPSILVVACPTLPLEVLTFIVIELISSRA